jgi:hypothetical protein
LKGGKKKEKTKNNRSLAGCIIKLQELMMFTKSKAAAEVS